MTVIAVTATSAAATVAATIEDPDPDPLSSSSHTGWGVGMGMEGGKMHLLTKRRDGLKRQGIAVAGDLTTRQHSIIKQYRDDGIRAYYKGNQLVVGGQLRPRLQNGRNHGDVGGGGGGDRGTQASQSLPSPSYSGVTQSSAVDRNATDVTSASTSGRSNTRANGMDSVLGLVTRNRA